MSAELISVVRILVLAVALWAFAQGAAALMTTYRLYENVGAVMQANQQLQAQLQATVKQANDEIAKREKLISDLKGE